MIKIRFWGRIIIFSYLFFAFILISTANASNGDRYLEIAFPEGSLEYPAGTALIRGGDIWVPDNVMRSAGVQLMKGPNGKGFLLEVKDPSSVFGIDSLEGLAGRSIVLGFPSLENEGISYFNVRGMEALKYK